MRRLLAIPNTDAAIRTLAVPPAATIVRVLLLRVILLQGCTVLSYV